MPEPIKNLIDILFYSPSGTILWGLSGFLIGNRLAIGRDKRVDFARAGNEFINAFKDFIVLLESGGAYERSGASISCPIPDHLSAAFVFRKYLWWFQRKCFDRKLAQYKQAADEYDYEVKKCYGIKNIPHETCLKLIKQINGLLKYANPK